MRNHPERAGVREEAELRKMLVGEAGFAESGAMGCREGRRGNEGLGGRHAGYGPRGEGITYVYVATDSLSSINTSRVTVRISDYGERRDSRQYFS